jgi:hypothetical protein
MSQTIQLLVRLQYDHLLRLNTGKLICQPCKTALLLFAFLFCPNPTHIVQVNLARLVQRQKE